MIRSLLLTVALLCSYAAAAFVAEPLPSAEAVVTFQTIDKTQLSDQLGRPLTLKKRLAVNTFNRRQLTALRKANQRLRKGLPAKSAYRDRNGLAVAGFTCGIVGLFVFPILLPQLAIIFSAIGLRRSNREGAPHRGMAIAGLVMGILGSLALLLLIGAIFAFSL